MANTLQVKRGLAANIGVLDQGELFFASDEDATYVGDGTANHRHIMDNDFVQTPGLMRKISANTYETVKDNTTATSNPDRYDDTDAGYSEESLWINTSTELVWICVDATADNAVWQQITSTNQTLTGTRSKAFVLLEPDKIQAVNKAIPIFIVDTDDEFPYGITITKIIGQASAATAATVTIQEWNDTGHVADIQTVDFAGSSQTSDIGINYFITSNNHLRAHLDTTDVDWILLQIYYTVNQS